jgi:SAM-dependent methyltransferase
MYEGQEQMLRTIADIVLAHPLAFQAFQALIGAPNCHRRFLDEHVQPRAGDAVLDIGCGTGNSLKFLAPEVRYAGVDINTDYVEYAKRKYDGRATFKVADATTSPLDCGTSFDMVFSNGVLHHLPDTAARRLLDNAMLVLKPGGVFLSIDPCFAPNQSPFARFLVSNDRGRYVRNEAGYRELFGGFHIDYVAVVSDMMRVPYTQIVVKLRK